MLTAEYLAERIAYHQERVESFTLAHDRAMKHGGCGDPDAFLKLAAHHAAIFTTLSAIAAGKH